MLDIPIDFALAPVFAQGETEANPKPVPKISKIKDNTAAAIAPAKIAPHDVAELAFIPEPSDENSANTCWLLKTSMLAPSSVFVMFMIIFPG